MRKWGIVISVVYALILLGLIVPVVIFFSGFKFDSAAKFFAGVRDAYQDWFFWVPAGAILVSQVLLLFLSVDTSQKRLKPRAHILTSVAVGAVLTALLSSAALWSVGFAIRGDKFWGKFFDEETNILLFWGGAWLLWAILFYFYFRNSSDAVTRLISWLLRGSVLELLIAVPCHVIVRRRQDCSAPLATSFGIATGIAIMLLSFGPSVLFLYKKRLDSYTQVPAV
ncbi:MAG TPA: hypothetical protein VJO16_15645 [Candidatus Acidoferrum sp.]|nr:hypothetical protein [Candidatus Acidoferrum sp.]